MNARRAILAQLADLTKEWAGTYDLDAAAADLEAQGVTDPESHPARDIVWRAVQAHEIVETAGERMRREITATMPGAPAGESATWEGETIRVEVTGYSRVNHDRPAGTWTITVGGNAQVVDSPASWDELIDIIDTIEAGVSMTHALALQSVRGAAIRSGDADQRAVVARAALHDEIRRALTQGVPVAKLAEWARVSPGRVYQIRDRRR